MYSPIKMDELLDLAQDALDRGRRQYGTPLDHYTTVAQFWSAYKDVEFVPEDVAVMLILLKIVRLRGNLTHMDSWVDIAGYAACGGEVASRPGRVTEEELLKGLDKVQHS